MVKKENIVGSRLKNLRIAMKMTQTEAAKGAGITNAALCLIESGKRLPGCDIIIGLCECYGVSADYLLGIKWDLTSLADQLATEAKKCFDIFDLKELSSYYDDEDEGHVKKLGSLLMEYMHIRGLDNE